MSIGEEVERRCDEGQLLALYPRAAGAPVRRMLYVTTSLYRMLTEEWPTEAETRRWAQLEAHLAHFVEGGIVDPSYLVPLNWKQRPIWEVKARRPKPSIRVFGMFAEVDVLVATNAAYRKPLGPKGSREWRNVIIDCLGTWRRLFPFHAPLPSSDIRGCVSDNVYTASDLDG